MQTCTNNLLSLERWPEKDSVHSSDSHCIVQLMWQDSSVGVHYVEPERGWGGRTKPANHVVKSVYSLTLRHTKINLFMESSKAKILWGNLLQGQIALACVCSEAYLKVCNNNILTLAVDGQETLEILNNLDSKTKYVLPQLAYSVSFCPASSLMSSSTP